MRYLDGLQRERQHPAHVLESRASNVDGPSIVCAREFALDLLEEEHVRDVLRLNERVFRFALSAHGLGVWVHDGVSVFDAVLRDPRLPEAFERVRFPQMRQELESRRAHAVELAYRAASAPLFVFEGHELRDKALVAKLRGADGTLSELANYRPGNSSVRAGDFVRLGANGQLDLMARGQARDRGHDR